ncbi:T9SS type A sorting domain-containing protein [Catalinimonas alkaloidigena]|uniref:T9SS type A sorting domain-containing protein n=1 Tax=Catalinimonas alkaloidigena TaxID=1075417 RepID=UPI000B7F12ED|nr:T9SS type A sorting domain-containing protein [Catalinimonas alkaloidigena]
MQNGSWNDSNTWQVYTGGAWTATTNIPDNARVYVRHQVTKDISVDTKGIFIQGGATLTLNQPTVVRGDSLVVENNGVLQMNELLTISSNSVFQAKSGGIVRLNYNFADATPSSTIWRGEEDFQPGSLVEVQQWNYARTLFASDDDMSQNSGYIFGHLTLSATNVTSGWTVFPFGPLAVTANRFEIKTQGAKVTLKGDNKFLEFGGDFISSAQSLDFTSLESGTATVQIKGSLQVPSGTTRLTSVANTGNRVIRINLEGDIRLNGNTLQSGSAAASDSSGIYFTRNIDSVETTHLFTATTQSAISLKFFVQSSSNVLLQNDVNLANNNARVEVMGGGILDFNNHIVTGSGVFKLNAGGILKITSPDGISRNGKIGNVQTSPQDVNRIFDQNSTFWYTGTTNQVTGNGVYNPSNSSTKNQIIIDNPTTVTLNNRVNLRAGGLLEIRQGTFAETTQYAMGGGGTNGVGNVRMFSDDCFYVIPQVPSSSSTTLPVLDLLLLPKAEGSAELTGGTLVLNGAGYQKLKGGKDYGNIVFAGSGIKEISTATPNVFGTVTIQDNAELNLGDRTLGGAATGLVMLDNSRLRTSGSGIRPNMGGAYDLSGNSTIVFAGDDRTPQTIRGSSGSLSRTYVNIEVTGTSVAQNTALFAIQKSFVVKKGATFGMSDLVISGPGSFAVEDSAHLIFRLPLQAAGEASGHIQVEGSRTYGRAIYEYYGAEGELGTGVAVAQQLKLRNGSLRLNRNLTVTDSLVIDPLFSSSGTPVHLYTTGSDFDYVVTLGPEAIIEGETSNGYVLGKLAVSRLSTGFGIVDMGRAGVEINVNGEFNLGQITLLRSTGEAVDTTVAGFPIINRTWEINSTNPIPADESLSFILYYLGSEQGDIDYPSAYWGNGVTWTEKSESTTVYDYMSGNPGLLVEEITDFGLFAFGESNLPLPVELLTFEGKAEGRLAHLTWSTLSETNNQGFEVEKSVDGREFETIGFVSGANNSTVQQDYRFTDDGFQGEAYYRLRQVDFDGGFEYSTIVHLQSSLLSLKAYPNPLEGAAELKLEINGRTYSAEDVQVQLVGADGRVLFQGSGELSQLTRDLNQTLRQTARGVYFIRLESLEGAETFRLLKR